MTTPTITPETFYDGPQGGPDGPTPVDSPALNAMWSAIMQVLRYQLLPRSTGVDSSVSIGEMLLVDTSGGDRHITAPVAGEFTGSWGVRHAGGPNKVIITTVGTDVLDETSARTRTLNSPTDEVVYSFVTKGRFTLAHQTVAPLPATPSSYGTVSFGVGGDLVGPANAITVPGKENVGVAANLLAAHRVAADPHGDRAWSHADAGTQITAHSTAADPHGDRTWAAGQFVPLSWFDGNGQLLPSHTSQLAITDTFVVANQAAMLALSCQTGDIAIRTDPAASGGQRSYILQGADPKVLANWTAITAAGQVTSVRGSAGSAMTGDVVLGYADIGAAGLNDARITGAQQTSGRSTPATKVANGYIGADASGNVPQGMTYVANTTTAGVIQLSGDLGGTYNNIQVLNKAPMFIPNTTVYTGATNPHTPVQGEIAQYNAVNNPITQVLPAAPTGTTVTILELKCQTPTSSTNTVTFTPAGTDTIDGVTAAGGGALTLRALGETRRLVGYQGNWIAQSGLNTYQGLDLRYLQIANARMVPTGGTSGLVLTKTGTADTAYGWTSIAGAVAAENVNYVPSSGASVALPDVTTATMHDVTLTAATVGFIFPAAGAGKSFTLTLHQDATGGRAVTWPAVLWPSATSPTRTSTANSTDILTFVSVQTGAATYAWAGMLSAKDVR